MSPRAEVLERFKGDPPGKVRHFGSPDRVEAALQLAREGWLKCEWVPVSPDELPRRDGFARGSSKTMLACVARPMTPAPSSGGGVA